MDSTPEFVSSEALGTAVQDVLQEADAVVEVSGAIAVQVSRVSGEVSTVADRLVADAKAQLRQGAETQLGQVADGLDRLRHQHKRWRRVDPMRPAPSSSTSRTEPTC